MNQLNVSEAVREMDRLGYDSDMKFAQLRDMGLPDQIISEAIHRTAAKTYNCGDCGWEGKDPKEYFGNINCPECKSAIAYQAPKSNEE